MSLPAIIQGGMGVGVSNWVLARAVCLTGQLGVVSGTALDQVLARRLQDGDPGGYMRRALAAFPAPEMSQRILNRFFIEGGKAAGTPYRKLNPPAHNAPREAVELLIVANFVEVFLAKEGHHHPAGINYLEKIQAPHLPSIYGAMLAGVDYILMGAGIPTRIPGVLDRFAQHQSAEYPLQVTGAPEGECTIMTFNPREYLAANLPDLHRPQFLAIIASNTLATTLLKKSNGRVDGFVVEGNTAGGHNAPPRGKMQLSETGEPIYGERDRVDFAKLRELGVPFWLAGGFGTPGRLQDALAAGATGIQVGTAFAFCQESGVREDYKTEVLAAIANGNAKVFTDPAASPTGFPFKVIGLAGTASEVSVYAQRPRVCDLGYLREAFRNDAGNVAYRCSGEPVHAYLSKGGSEQNAAGSKCLCNGLLANIGMPQVRGTFVEPGLLTAGDDLPALQAFFSPGAQTYTAADVIRQLTAA